MKRWFLLALLFVWGGCVSQPKESEPTPEEQRYAQEVARIKGEIDKANFCEARSDCVNLGSKCPFACYIVVNKSEEATIRALVEGFAGKINCGLPCELGCQHHCASLLRVVCLEKKCKAIVMGTTTGEAARD